MNNDFIHVHNLSEVTEQRPSFVAIGSFDGVHLGHQAVLKSMVAAANEVGARTAVLTFFPHPQRVLQNLTDPYYLATLEDRVRWIAEQGIEIIVTHPFDERVRTTRAHEFVNQLCRYLEMRQLWGGDFAFGYKREGDVPFLRQLGTEKGYTVQLVNGMVQFDGALISSSRIRQSLRAGDMGDVQGCLGRPYLLQGTIIQGEQRGRTIGFPTANFAFWEEQLLPTNGVYATYVTVGETRYKAATNVGVRPTVDGNHLTVEAHLLDFAGDLYGQQLRLEFIEFVRAEKKFANLEQLKAQINNDIIQIRLLLT